MSEGWVSQVVRERDGLGEVFVQAQRPSDGTRDAGDFDGVGEPGAQVVARAVEKDLRLVFEPAERS